ncbi:MAG: hypothetical protein WAN93_00315 [Solirubrobacteraceae bacterium]
MKRSYLIGLTLVAVLASTAFAASSAFALESTWLVSGAKPTAAVNVDSESGSTSLEDVKGGIFGEAVAVTCKVLDKGTVGPGPADTVTAVTLEECATTKGICPSPVATAVNLPWNTKIELIGTAFYDDIVSSGVGNPGYTVSCSGVVDTCTAMLGRPLDKENTAGGAVLVEFNPADTNQPAADCTKGGTGQGLVKGTQTILTEVAGLALAFSEG